MSTSTVNSATVVLALIAGLVVLHESQNLIGSLAGLTILVALFALEHDGVRSGMQSFAFSLVCGLAFLCMCSYPLSALLPSFGLSPAFLTQYFPALFWVLATAIFWFVDRSRADAGQPQPVSLGGYSQPIATQPQIAVLKPTYEARPFASAPIVSEPQPDLAYADSPVAPVAAAPFPKPPPTASTPVPPVLSGKEVSIYINMLGEGMNVLRSVRAEHLGRDFYIIVEEMPSDENWEYVPGQVVRCKKKNLSNGKGLVAYEEAPRAQ